MSRGIKFQKKTMIALLITSTITAAVPLTIKAYNTRSYINYLSMGQEYLNSGNYEEAVVNFDNALRYNSKDRQIVNGLIDDAVMLKQSRDAFDKGARLLYEKKYLEAIDSFGRVSENDDLRYEVAQSKIKECKEIFSHTNLTAAQNEAARGKYETSLSYIEAVLKLDPLNQAAISLKNQYNSIIAAKAAEQQKKTMEQLGKQASGINLTTMINNYE